MTFLVLHPSQTVYCILIVGVQIVGMLFSHCPSIHPLHFGYLVGVSYKHCLLILFVFYRLNIPSKHESGLQSHDQQPLVAIMSDDR